MGQGLVTVAVVDVDQPARPNRQLDAARERADPYGGVTVSSSERDLAAVFPTPREALAFAMAVQAAASDAPDALRIGITIGEPEGNERSCRPVVAAARHLAQRAGAGEVLVCEATRHLAGASSGLHFVDRGPLQPGGPATGRASAAFIGEPPTSALPVFGRDSELRCVEWLLAGLAGERGRTLVLEGEAGIGKTHLVRVIADRARTSGATVVQGRGDELEYDRPGRILLNLAEGLGLRTDALLTDTRRLGGSRGFALIEAVIESVEEITASAGVVLLAEDLHWGDELSLRGIAALCRQVPRLPLAVVMTFRPHPRPGQLDAVLRSLEGLPRNGADSRHVRLGGMDAAAVGSIVAARTGAAPGPVLSSRLAGAAGNPMFIIELLDGVIADGQLHVDAGLAETTTPGGVPSTLREAVLGRLSSLPRETQELLRIASLIGSEFSLSDLATVTGRSIVDCAARLQEALQAAILTDADDRLTFRHDVIREAVYEDLVPTIRRDMHVAAGRALQAAGAPAQHVARQYALGSLPGDLNAVEWLQRAAHDALALDPGAAADLLQRAVDLCPPAWSGTARLEAALLEPLALSGRIDEAQDRATTLLGRAMPPDDEFATRRGLAAVLATTGDVAAAAAECERAARVPGPPAEQRQLLRCVATCMSIIVSGSAEAVRAAAQGHLDDAERRDDRELACWAHQGLGLAALAAARYDDALHHVRASRRLLDAGWVPAMGFLIPHLWEGSAFAYLDRFDEGIDAYRTARHRAETRGETGLLVLAHAGRGSLHYLCGQWDDAVSEVEVGMSLADETGARAMTLLSHAILARIALGRGELEAADHHVTAGLQVSTITGHRIGLDVLLWAQAGLHEAQGHPDAAHEVLARLWHTIAPIRFLMQYRNLGPDLIRLSVQAGRTREAERVTRILESAARRSTSASSDAAALRGRGLVDNDPDMLLRAVDRYRGTPRRLELAATCEDAAATLVSTGRHTDATPLLDEAATIHLHLGADHDLARLDALSAGLSTRRRSRRPRHVSHGWGALSDKEREVVDLVAKGLSNPEIGRQLFISRRTVETHLSHIFEKLGVANRVQLATLASSRDTGAAPRSSLR